MAGPSKSPRRHRKRPGSFVHSLALGDTAMDDENADGIDIHKFATYEDYLDSQITEQDKFYLEVRPRSLARGYELAYRVLG